jgi:hypothetical protein
MVPGRRNDVVAAGKEAGFSYDQLNGARGRLGAECERSNNGTATGKFVWWLPKEEAWE